MPEPQSHPVHDIAVDAIKIGDRLWEEDNVDDLLASMPVRGLLNPITVMQVGWKYKLVAGRRRLLAARKLGWKTIAATVQPEGKNAAVDEAIENLHRRDLGTAERSIYEKVWADHMLETKEAATKREIQQAAAEATNQKRSGSACEPRSQASKPAASALIAQATGQTERQLQKRLAIAPNLTPELVAEVKGTKADTLPALKEITRQPTPEARLEKARELINTPAPPRQQATASQVVKEQAARTEAARIIAENDPATAASRQAGYERVGLMDIERRIKEFVTRESLLKVIELAQARLKEIE